jgi:hypothetical protein
MKKRMQQKLEKKHRLERQRRRQEPGALAYRGNKFKGNDLLPFVYQTEVGIYESFVISGRKITDHDVRATLEYLIRGIRGGTIVVSSHRRPDDNAEKAPAESLIAWNIRRRWDECFATEPFPGRDNLIGVLRTILGSIETWGNISPTSRGYLHYIEGFMGQLGVQCRKVSSEFVADLENEEAALGDLPDDPDEDELLLAGRAWAQEADSNARIVFHALAEELIAAGQAEAVAEACQQLMGESDDRRIIDELGALSVRAQQRIEPHQSRLHNFLGRLIGR